MSFRAWQAALCGVALCVAAPAFAQEGEAAIDALLDASETPDAALTLARSQASAGDLIGAATTLERALLSHPPEQTGAVRLYYASILCRLGDPQTASSALARLDAATIDPAGWNEVEAACGPVARPAAPRAPGSGDSLSGELAVGIGYDSDLTGTLLIQFDLPGVVPVPSDDGFSLFGSGRVAGRANSGNMFFYGNAGALMRDSISGPSTSYQIGDASFGFGVSGGNAEISVGAVLRHARIAGDPFMTELGGESELGVAVGTTGRLSVRGEVVRQDYSGSSATFSRDGTRVDVALSVQGNGTTRFALGLAYEDKTAETARTGYSGFRGFGGFRAPIGSSGIYGSGFASLRQVNYVDETGFPPVEETRFFGRAALGVPIGDKGLSVEGAVNYSARDYNSSSTLRDYESVGGELRLVWSFGN